MGENITLTCKDGTKIGAYVARPNGQPRGGMVVVQEIFGVNSHIRADADRYAAAGYLAIAPAIFDRIEPGVELTYDGEDRAKGIALMGKLDNAKTVEDLEAAIAWASQAGKVGIVGYCLGGSLAYLAACRMDGIAAAVGYYGSRVAGMSNEKPKVPVILHFGDKDASIPMADVEKVKAARPDVPVYVYAAGHGFNCDERASFDKEAAELARKRSLDLFAEHI